ncbi:uncharacterized protein EAE97_007936 [Botrytis byssoidea]|uniref:Heterokaryon incompatibility domain-containing protein n=1 Tax=Botrytis byssoidea TaxID=139641 RepID=A0A9P5IK87_9HELO|nr:uncharacterized protein EAE97_007936 [Botrytis byssoidea]KAF7936570.1 hypothetical protein EAE97_007936 [Botrytis byssoidea]
MEVLPKYSYTSLDTSKPSIRLLRLQRNEQGSISGLLEVFSLDDPERPVFRTLSYVWGPKVFPHSILINGHPFPVLSSLHPLLEIICDDEKWKQSWWWIDSICIDQNVGPIAEVERNIQVAMMRRIYEKSERTIGWLGLGDDEGEQAIQFLKMLASHKKRLDLVHQRRLGGKRRAKEEELGSELSDRSKWAALEKLLLRPWWTRVWTLQEYLVPRTFVFQCGQEAIDRRKLTTAMSTIGSCRRIDETLLAHKSFEAPWIRRRVFHWYQRRAPVQLIGLMGYISNYKASDPRDRIYSVLGLAADGFLADPPRYQDSFEVVYSNLVKSFLEKHKSLDIICFVDRFRCLEYSHGQPILPSWVPDWRADVQPWMVPAIAAQSGAKHVGNLRPIMFWYPKGTNYDIFMAGKSNDPLKYNFSTDLRILTCQGVFVDFVDGIGGLKVVYTDEDKTNDEVAEVYQSVESTSTHETSQAAQSNAELLTQAELDPEQASRYMDHIFRCLMLNRQDRYLSQDISAKEFSYLEFQAFCFAAMTRPGDVYPLFLDWFERNRTLRIGSHSLEQICKAAPLPKSEFSTDYDFMDISTNEQGFISRFRDTTKWMARRLMTTNQGLIGMVSCRARKSDQVWILLGCSIPLILRKWEDNEGYQVIGECYLHGYMSGEIQEEVSSGIRTVEDVCLL